MAGATADTDDEQATAAFADGRQAPCHRVHLPHVDRGGDVADRVEVGAGVVARLHPGEGTAGRGYRRDLPR